MSKTLYGHQFTNTNQEIQFKLTQTNICASLHPMGISATCIRHLTEEKKLGNSTTSYNNLLKIYKLYQTQFSHVKVMAASSMMTFSARKTENTFFAARMNKNAT